MADVAATRVVGHRFHWRALVVALAGLLVTGLVWAVAFLANYEPLAPGSGFVGALGRGHRSPNTWGAHEIDIIKSGTERFRVGFPIYNDGALAVTIVDVEFPSEDMETPVIFNGLRMAPASFSDSSSIPFRPTRLEPGENLQLYITGTFTGCGKGDLGLGWYDSQDVRYRVFGITKTQTLTMHHRIGSHCPERRRLERNQDRPPRASVPEAPDQP